MKSLYACMIAVVAAAAPGAALAQRQPTTAQLPTYSYFGVATSVVVPDRGSTYLGGVNRASSGRNEFGAPLSPFGNRSIGSERSAASMRVSVYVHDFQAMEEAILRQAAASTLQPRWPVAGWSGGETQPAVPAQAASVPGSVADIRRERARQQLSREEEAADFFARGRAAGREAQPGKIYYQMAARAAAI